MILIWQPFLSLCFLAAEGIGGWVESDGGHSNGRCKGVRVDQRRRDGHNTRQVNERKENIKSTYDRRSGLYRIAAGELRVTCVIAYVEVVTHEVKRLWLCCGGRCGMWGLYFSLYCPMLSET